MPADRSGWVRPAAASLLLLVGLFALSFLNDIHGYLGTDTGGKVATLRTMDQRGGLDPDLGYWAQRWDPTGRLYPLYYTAHLKGKWVNVTTLPALYAAYPLFKVGGYRGALLVPMLGTVLAALAARALARRLGAAPGTAGAAFWIVGLASPLTIYALDFWEHSLGVALVGWAAVLLLDAAESSASGRGRAGRALGAGALFGLAATMRTEALAFGAVAVAVTIAVVLWRHRNLIPGIVIGAAALVGLAVPLLANSALEQAAIGSTLRAARATNTVRTAVQGSGQTESRFEEAALTGIALEPTFTSGAYLRGAALLALLVLAATGTAKVARLALAGAVVLYLLRFSQGLAFVPGLIAATPLAAVGLASVGKHARLRAVVAMAGVAIPVVWATQYTGGAAPQWAGRYLLPAGLLLGTAGVVALAHLDRRIAAGLVALAVAVTAFGAAWTSSRTHSVGNAATALAARPEPVLISREAHLWRESGWYAAQRRWLTAVTGDDLRTAVDVVGAAGFDRFGLAALEGDGADPAPPIAGYRATHTDRIRFAGPVWLTVTTYEKAS